MKVIYNSDKKEYEATQITGAPKDVIELGLVNVPIGHWIISQNGTPIQCPSDLGFKENYTPSNTTVSATIKTNDNTGTEISR